MGGGGGGGGGGGFVFVSNPYHEYTDSQEIQSENDGQVF